MPQRDSRPAGRSPRRALLLAPLIGAFVVAGVYRLLGEERRVAVDTAPAYQAAQVHGAFPVASPDPLPAGWRELNADFQSGGDGVSLRIGLRAPAGGAVRLIESAEPEAVLLTAELGDRVVPRGEVDLDGRLWRRYAGERGLRALVLSEAGRTVILVGAARDSELRDLAKSLR